MEYAEWEFRQNRSTSDGASAGDHMESAARQWASLPGRKPKIIEPVPEGPPFPEELDYLWSWLGQITMGLSVSGMAPPTVSWEAIRAWQALMGIAEIEPWEAEVLVQLGMLRAGIQAERTQQEKPISGTKGKRS